MIGDPKARGGATVSTLTSLEAWEANLVLNLRLWCEGPRGQRQVMKEYRTGLPFGQATPEYEAFEAFLQLLINCAHRPLIRHSVDCACVGSDEAVFLNLVRTASDGHLRDAALIATLLVAPARAEQVAILATQVGAAMRTIHHDHRNAAAEPSGNVVRLH